MRTPRATPRWSRPASPRPVPRCALLVLAIGCGLLSVRPADGQPPEAPPPVADQSQPVTDQAQEDARPPASSAWPDTSVWIDDNGVPRPLVGVTYDEFAKAWRQYQGLGERQRSPRFTLHALRVEGDLPSKPRSDAVALTATIELQTHEPGRVGVPIRLPNAIYVGGVEGLDPKTEHLAYDDLLGGYVLWLRGGDQTRRRTVTVKLLASVRRSPDSVRLRLNLPRATESRLVLRADRPVLTATTSEGRLVTPPDQERPNRIEVIGAVGTTTISYRSQEAETAAEQTVLRARGKLLVRIEDRNVRTTATITVDAIERPFDRFLVRLPAGATHLPDPANRPRGVRITPVLSPQEKPSPDGEQEQPNLLEVSRTQRSSEPLTIRLVAARPLRAGEAGDEPIDLAGFGVVGALFQSGDVAITVAEGVQLDWGRAFGVAQIEPTQLPDELARQSPSRACRYYRQAWRLPVSVGESEPRIEASPDYRLEVFADEALLTMDTDFRVGGGGAFEFAFDLNGWDEPEDDPIGPVGLIDANQTHTSAGRLILPLTRSAGRRDRLTLKLWRPLANANKADADKTDPEKADPDGPEKIRIPLPVPVADTLRGGRLTLVSAPGVSLQVTENQTLGLEPIALRPASDTDPDDSGFDASDDPGAIRTLAFRVAPSDDDRLKDRPPTLTAEIRRRPQQLTIDSRAEVAFAADTLRVTQRLRYNALYQPVDRLLLIAPPGVDLGAAGAVVLTGDPSTPTVNDDEVVLSASPVVPDGGGPEAADLETPDQPQTVWWSVSLPGPRLGAFGLRVEMQAPLPPTTEEPMEVPLLTLPRLGDDTESRSSRVDASPPPGFAVSLAEGETTWQEADGQTARFAGDGESGTLWLQLTKKEDASPEPDARVLRAWFQTWDAGGERQTRAVYRVVSSSPNVAVRLPGGVDADKIEVKIDGALAPLRQRGDDYWLSDASLADGRPHTIATRHRRPLPSATLTRLEAPQLLAEGALAECYWEVVQPALQHVIAPPARFAGHHRWAWRDGWGRQPLLDHAAFAERFDADVGPAPSAGEHRYLFRTVGLPNDTPVARSVGRAAMVFTLSAAALLIGFVLSQMRLLRYRATYYALAAGAATAGSLAPGPALFALQSAGVGLALAAVTILVHRLLRGQQAHAYRPLVLAEQSTSFGNVEPRRRLQDEISTNAPTASLATGEAAGDA